MGSAPSTKPVPRSDLLPASAIPLAYFGLAHVALAAGVLALLVAPSLPGGFFYHPKMIALVHLLTLGWLSGSIVGALYIAGPLALGCRMPARWPDWTAFASYAIGVSGMVSHFWISEYAGMAWSAALVTGAIGWVAVRVWRGLSLTTTVPWAVALHVRLAFLNVVVAAGAGIVIGLDRVNGFLPIPALAATYAHAHLAAIGWVGLMVVGLAYRLIPMMLPCAMPSGRSVAMSAVLIECGLAIVVTSLIAGSSWLALGAALIVAGFASSAAAHLGRAVRARRPRPPGLPAPDWSVRQVGTAAVWLGIAVIAAMFLLTGVAAGQWYAMACWVYGIAGLVGWQAQMVAGVQGRLVPLYAWYRELARRGAPPPRSAHELMSAPLARVVFLGWAAGVPLLAASLPAGFELGIRAGAAALLAGIVAGGGHIAVIVRRARESSLERTGVNREHSYDCQHAHRTDRRRASARDASVRPPSDRLLLRRRQIAR